MSAVSWIKRFLPATFLVFALVLAACGDDSNTGNSENESNGDSEGAAVESELDRPIVFADYNWDGPLFHNRVARFILENGYGHETEFVSGETIPLFQGQINGEIDVSMEVWLDQMPTFQPAVDDGTIVDLGPNFEDGVQGWWVPTYMIEGDEERGIDPITPDLKHVDQLPEYKDVFSDPEEPDKGRFHDGVAGWELEKINEAKFEAYGLNEHYNRFLTGSNAALDTSLVRAYEQGEPWFGFMWTPSWVSAEHDMTRLEEPEYTDECWEEIYEGNVACEFPVSEVHISVTSEFADEAPEVTEFLDNYTTTEPQNSAALAHMATNDVGHEEAAIWFLEQYPDTWHEWVPEDVVERVESALDEQTASN